ncbi:MAG: pyrroline-5-carboxylate reductase [Bacteroidales bacterium]
MKITIIGTGNIGSAIATGLVKSRFEKSSNITCADLLENNLNKIKKICRNINTTTDSTQNIEKADIIVIAVKPWIMEKAINQIKSKLNKNQIIVSVVAGTEFKTIKKYLEIDGSNENSPSLFRIVPNIAIEVRSSLTFVCSDNATEEQEKLIISIFNKLGGALLIDEAHMAAGTALASCGIAFALRYIRAAIEGGVEMGFYPKQTQKIVTLTVKGAVDLLMAHQTNPEEEIDKVTTPGGITIKGLNKMEEEGFSSAVIKGLKASTSKNTFM